MTISETIKNLEAIKERFGDLEVFVPEVIKYDDGISFKTIYHECMISAQSQRDGLIIDKIVILANDALLTALQQSENAQVAHIKNSANDCKIYVMNVKYELGKYRAYMGIIRQVNYNLWLQMYARDNANMLKLDKVNELI